MPVHEDENSKWKNGNWFVEASYVVTGALWGSNGRTICIGGVIPTYTSTAPIEIEKNDGIVEQWWPNFLEVLHSKRLQRELRIIENQTSY